MENIFVLDRYVKRKKKKKSILITFEVYYKMHPLLSSIRASSKNKKKHPAVWRLFNNIGKKRNIVTKLDVWIIFTLKTEIYFIHQYTHQTLTIYINQLPNQSQSLHECEKKEN